MKALIIMHVESEGPGTLGTFVESQGMQPAFARLYAGDDLPQDLSGLDAVISMGGPMNVYEEDEYPFLRDETLFLHKAVSANMPVMGICLGAQMIAKASGALVTKSPQKEVGWCKVSLTEEGRGDILFQGLPDELDVLQWHGDMFHIPEGGTLLATSDACPHQAFRIRNAFGLQFHVEVTPEILSQWFEGTAELDEILAAYGGLNKDLATCAERMYRNFLGILR